MGGSSHLSNEIKERRQPTNRNKDQLEPYLKKRRASIYSLFAVSNEVVHMMCLRGRISTLK